MNVYSNIYYNLKISIKWGLGIGDWGLGIGEWEQYPIPNPQTPNNKKNNYLFKNKNKHIFKFKI